MSYIAALVNLPPRYRDVHRAMHLDNWVQYVSANLSSFPKTISAPDLAKALEDALRKHLDSLIAQERADAEPPATRRHVYVALVTLGIAMALEEVTAARPADVRAHVLGHFRQLVMPLFEMTRRRLARAASPEEAFETFVSWARNGTENLYGPPGFDVVEVCADARKGYAFDIRACLYWELFRKHGRPDLGPVLCEYDHILFDVLKEYVAFGRSGTLASGRSCCDFRCAKAGVDPLSLEW